jgi:hypothetical protein
MGNGLAPDRIRRLILSENAIRESSRIFRHFIRHILGREPRSLQVLDEIKKMM